MHRNLLTVTAALTILAATSYVTGCGGDAASPGDAPAAITAEPEPVQQAANDSNDASDANADTAADTGAEVDSGVMADAGVDAADAAPLTCIATQYVAYPVGSCGEDDSPGTCTARTVVCSGLLKPVCGCNGAIYANACKARSVGQNLRSLDVCPK